MTPDAIRNRVAQFAQAHPRTAIGRSGVQHCNEFLRIDLLPRRSWPSDAVEELIDLLTGILKKPGGKQRLRREQAIALYEWAENDGLLVPIDAGGGKTLIWLLAPRVVPNNRACVVMPASLVAGVRREMYDYAEHWNIASNLSIVSYSQLGVISGRDFLENLKPDILALDEAHYAKNPKASCTRRIDRYIRGHQVRVMSLSGTMHDSSLRDWAHHADWCLGPKSPAPRKWSTVEHWGLALDKDATLPAGALGAWRASDDEPIRVAYRRRVNMSPGVVASREAFTEVALRAEPITFELSDTVKAALKRLDDDYELPDGWPIEGPLEYQMAECLVALGCYYRWKEKAPKPWIKARRHWGRFVRHCVRYSTDPQSGKPLDSENQVAMAILHGGLRKVRHTIDTGEDKGTVVTWEALFNWHEQKQLFSPTKMHVWFDEQPIIQLAMIACQDPPAILWTEHTAIGRRFEKYGIPYYGRKGLTDSGAFIKDADPTMPLAASRKANATGRNLQAWSRAILTAPLRHAGKQEQLIARQHRPGQKAKECIVQVCLLTPGHHTAWQNALRHAAYLEEISGPQRLMRTVLIGACQKETIESGDIYGNE